MFLNANGVAERGWFLVLSRLCSTWRGDCVKDTDGLEGGGKETVLQRGTQADQKEVTQSR